MNFTNGKQLLEICSEKHIPISRAMFLRETDYLEQDPVGDHPQNGTCL